MRTSTPLGGYPLASERDRGGKRPVAPAQRRSPRDHTPLAELIDREARR